jgi:Cu2+-exporting ATPase
VQFDLRIFGQSDADNAIRRVEQLSGFTCTRVVHLGDELDLFLDPNAPKLGDEWPIGVTDIKDTGENKIRVSFNPKVIGARNLLSHEFLRSASLAPPPPPPMIALGTYLLNVTLTLWNNEN